jgi:hypothetical protein
MNTEMINDIICILFRCIIELENEREEQLKKISISFQNIL